LTTGAIDSTPWQSVVGFAQMVTCASCALRMDHLLSAACTALEHRQSMHAGKEPQAGSTRAGHRAERFAENAAGSPARQQRIMQDST
jgi:hypothetical protein